MQSKYKAVSVTDAKYGRFDSKKEYKRFQELKELEKECLIYDLRRQVKYELIPSQPLKRPRMVRKGKNSYTERSVFYIADFVYKDVKGVVHVEDTKGVLTDVYKIKRKLMLWRYGIQIEEV